MIESTGVTTVDLEAALLTWIPQQRWFAAKGTPVVSLDIVERVRIGARPDVTAEHLLVDIGLDAPLAQNPQVQRYQVPLGFRSSAPDEVAAWQLPLPGYDVVVYDGMRDPAIISLYGDALAESASFGRIDFETLAEDSVDSGLVGRVLGAEQSNTSVVLGEVLLLKLFRRISPGVNPDIELHRALAEAGCDNVAPLRGWIQTEEVGDLSMLGMAQDFVVDSAEGWTAALASVTDLIAGGATDAFAVESFELGKAVARVHADLATELGTSRRPASELVQEITERVEAAALVVPELAECLPAARELIARARSGETTVHRIHGDLHLGQVLRTPLTWLLIDFEGEPSKSLEERRRPDSPLRDVAGMLRSFDYAAHHLLVDGAGPDGAGSDGAGLDETVATRWVEQNSAAFCEGYASVTGEDPRATEALLGAYELDKAAYEAVYEARNRPTWLDIPMRAVRRLAPPART